MVIIETAVFTRQMLRLWTDDEYREFQAALLENPELGPIIVGTGGARKVRWTLQGRGKSGGARVIYSYLTEEEELYLLLIYDKHQQESLSDEQKKQLKTLIDNWKSKKKD